jgi:hypothetical protein
MVPYSARWGPPLFPLAAHVFSVLGGVLIAVVGVADVVVAYAFRWQPESAIPGSSAVYAVTGVVGVVSGVAISVLGFRLRTDPRTARSSGIGIVALSLVSLFGGAGLFVGLVFAFVGGIMAMTWQLPFYTVLRASSRPYTLGRGELASSSTPPLPPTVTQRFCESCGTANPLRSRSCSKCGASLY